MDGILPEKESESTAALRAQLEQELKNKKQCSYSSYECTQLSLDGYKYCSRHILQDKTAPFKQCTYTYGNNGKRCNLPAPRSDKKEYGYCNEHALKATLARNKQNSKFPPPNTAEVLLNSLTHYIKKPRTRNVSSSTDDGDKNILDEATELKVTKSNDPFVDLEANSIYNDRCNAIMDYCSDSESDIEPSTFSSVWHDYQADSSENESIDSDVEDPLKHANVYTAEEITLITRDKLIRLQSLYIEQYRHLQYLLREKRRKYLHSLKREKETCCNIYNQVRDNPKEQRLYKKLKALNNYHRYHGQDRILNKRYRDLRNKMTDGTPQKTHSSSKCTFTEGGVKCGEKVMPLAKHCRKHILEDPNQVLFKPCGKMTGDVECTTPIAMIFEDITCPLHMEIPPLKSYNQTRKDSESDMDDSAEAHLQHFAQFTESVKHEFLNYNPPEIPKMETVPSLLFEENSQSMSESTVSQSDLYSTTFENGPSENIDLSIKYEKEIDIKNESFIPEQEEEIKTEVAISQMDESSHESGFFQGFDNQNDSNQAYGKFESKLQQMMESQPGLSQALIDSYSHTESSKVINESQLKEEQSLTVTESQLKTLTESYDHSFKESHKIINEQSITSNETTLIVPETNFQNLGQSDENFLNIDTSEVLIEEQVDESLHLEENLVEPNDSRNKTFDQQEIKSELEEQDIEMNEINIVEEHAVHESEMAQEEVCMAVGMENTGINDSIPLSSENEVVNEDTKVMDVREDNNEQEENVN